MANFPVNTRLPAVRLPLTCATVDHIPLVYIMPGRPLLQVDRLTAVIWLPGFSGTKEATDPQLRALADAGFLAISFDPWQHGARAVESTQELRARVHGNIARHFWPMLAHTAEEVPRILDFACEKLGAAQICGVGGISMGGDIAVSAAGLDQRIRAVAACIATGDWLRSGSSEPPGAPDNYAVSCYARCNPLSNAHRYTQDPALLFLSGELDKQVPPDGGERFQQALRRLFPSHRGANCGPTIYGGLGHEFVEPMMDESIEWFKLWLAPRQTGEAKA